MRMLAAAALCLIGTTAIAQQSPCGPTGILEKRIKDQYGESIVGAGFVTGGTLFIIANPETGTFTILLRRPDGQSCVLQGGTGFTAVDAVIPGENL